MPHTFKDAAYFIVSLVIVRHIIVNWIGNLLEKILVKTKRDAILWMHYELRARKKGHTPKHPKACGDGNCVHVS